MLEKNTVVLDLTTYNRFKEIEEKYNSLQSKLDNCLIKIDKKGNVVKPGFYIDNPTQKIRISISELCKILEIQNYEVEIID